jgi:hypothetical protein
VLSRSWSLDALVCAPALYALAFVLTVYADSGSAVEALPRPLLVAGVAAIATQAVLTLLFRNRIAGALVALVILIGVVLPLLAMTLALCLIAILVFARWRRFPAMRLVLIAGPMAVIMFSISAVRVVTDPTFNPVDVLRGNRAIVSAASADAPDIFLLMLDGYPSSDTLASWGYDNQWFDTALEERGFHLSSESHADYALTELVLPTLFHMRPLNEIAGLQRLTEEQDERRRAIRDALREAPALRRLQELGYTTISAGRPADYITVEADQYLDGGRLTEFEHQVLNRTMLADLALPAVLDARRGQILDTLEYARAVSRNPASTFMFGHVMSPHLPFLFDREGRPPCTDCPFTTHLQESAMTPVAFRQAYTDQVHHLNHLVLEAIDDIVTSSPEAVVIVFSDHGSRADLEDEAEWFKNYFAARTPGHPDLFPDDVHPVEVFPQLFDTLFGTSWSALNPVAAN